MKAPIVFVVPGPLDQLTGGYLFDRRIVDGLRAQGRTLRVVELPGRFPRADAIAREAARDLTASLSNETVLVIDGLALPAFESLLPLKQTAAAVGFVHHPLSLETGLSPEQVRFYTRLESALWSTLDGVICASPSSARSVCAAGVAAERVQVASPGVDLPAPISASARPITRASDAPVRLLCVATITARKGHQVLVEALARLTGHAWTLDCYGSLDRDPDTVRALQQSIAEHGLRDRVRLHGEQSALTLARAWQSADLFVLPSFHEGYGMVLTEAIAHGLPVVSTRAGAIPETVPAAASQLVDPGDTQALSRVLAHLIADCDAREVLRRAALSARAELVSWPRAVDGWQQALDQCVNRARVAA